MKCAFCGEDHPIDSLELSYRRPDDAASLAEDERSERVQENADLCIIDGKRFFVRGVLPLPVEECERPYNLGVWVEVSQPDFERIYALWDEPNQVNEPRFSAVLANNIDGLPPTVRLAAELELTGPTTRPGVHVALADHPLYEEQNAGVSPHRAHEYSSFFAKSAA